mmetsp:Transcript_5280/g.10759  ORF Transcript_5280/g.10759 Transcript_5280/m.10759 type:complete len:114 (-) Transcript_5280:409-750(-)
MQERNPMKHILKVYLNGSGHRDSRFRNRGTDRAARRQTAAYDARPAPSGSPPREASVAGLRVEARNQKFEGSYGARVRPVERFFVLFTFGTRSDGCVLFPPDSVFCSVGLIIL